MDDTCSSGLLVPSSSAFGPSACRPPSAPQKGAQGALGEAVQLAGVTLPSLSTWFQATISSTLCSTPPPLTHLAAWLRENHFCDSQVSRAGHPGFGCKEVGPPCSKQSVVLLSQASRPAGSHPQVPRERAGLPPFLRAPGPGRTPARPCPWGQTNFQVIAVACLRGRRGSLLVGREMKALPGPLWPSAWPKSS